MDDDPDDGDDTFNDVFDDLGDPLPLASSNSVIEGAAVDAADDGDERLKGLPRILRYVMLVQDRAESIELRLAAEIDELCPDLASNLAWVTTRDADIGLTLAADLDQQAVTRDLPLLRSLGDCVRLLSLSLSLSCDPHRLLEFRRVTRTLIMAFDGIASDLDETQRNDLERFICGWAALPMATGATDSARRWPAIHSAPHLGDRLAAYRIRHAAVEATRRMQHQIDAEKEASRKQADHTPAGSPDSIPLATIRSAQHSTLPLNHMVIAEMNTAEMKSPKLKDIIEPVRPALNVALPLHPTPPLDLVRGMLMAEFPYAVDAIDLVLTGLIGKPIVRLQPILLVGEPGGGKSRFARRLGEILGLTTWQVDATQADGSSLGGTDRRWHSSECCHPLLAIARGRIANPLIIIDELEKAATRTDYGRLWDCLLGLIEPETARRYPDPALQIPLDLSHINYVATANTLDPLPMPLRDRFRIVIFPKPTLKDLDALLPTLIKTLATERGIDKRWVAPLDDIERAAIANTWPGGSVRKLQRILEAILQTRDRTAPRH